MTKRTPTRWIAVLALTAMAGCDLSVSNLGPVQDEFLDASDAHPAVVTGMSLALSRALTLVSFIGADAAKEYTQGGRTHPTKLPIYPGQLTRDGISSQHWEAAQSARWIAEDGIRRLREAQGGEFDSNPLAARALLYAGYANRLLGENMCEGVIDGGEIQSHHVYFERADEHFSEAMAVAARAGETDLEQAARAGRASVLLSLGQYAEAAAHASQVPDGFAFQAVFSGEMEDQFNFVYYVSSNTPFRAHSVVDTYYEDYYQATGDPRVSWSTDPETPNAEVARIPWLFQTKYTQLDDPVNLSSGREMRLLEAEVALRSGQWQQALQLINRVRTSVISDETGQPLQPWTASGPEEAWTHLKRERGIELWLEGRRMGDLRRWIADSTPGDMEDVSDRVRLCFPIAETERRTNTNIALDHADPRNPLYTGDLQ